MNTWLWLAVAAVVWVAAGFLLSLALGRVIRHAGDQYPPVKQEAAATPPSGHDGLPMNGG